MSVECGECERDLRGGHDVSCSRWDPGLDDYDCECDPEWHGACPVHGYWTDHWLTSLPIGWYPEIAGRATAADREVLAAEVARRLEVARRAEMREPLVSFRFERTWTWWPINRPQVQMVWIGEREAMVCVSWGNGTSDPVWTLGTTVRWRAL